MSGLFNLLAISVKFTTENVLKALEYMGKGMLGIFIVIAILVLGVTLLNKATSPKEKKDEGSDN